MIPSVLLASAGLVLGGPALALLCGVATYALARFGTKKQARPPVRALVRPPVRLVLILALVELRSGASVLAALQRTAQSLPEDAELQKVTRLATVVGLTRAVEDADPRLRPIVAQLARAQRSGASLSATVHRMLEKDLADERARRMSAARSLPVRLMIPIALLMLPGLMLLLYAPSLYALFNDLTGAWS